VPSLGVFLGVFLGPCSWGSDGGNLWEPFVVLWAVIPPQIRELRGSILVVSEF
jgi:hypothetical protein